MRKQLDGPGLVAEPAESSAADLLPQAVASGVVAAVDHGRDTQAEQQQAEERRPGRQQCAASFKTKTRAMAMSRERGVAER